MKNRNIILFSCIILTVVIFSICFISADETDVIITGMKGYVFNVTVNMVKADGWDSIPGVDSIENSTDSSTGTAKFHFTSASQKVSFYIIARSNGKILTTIRPADIGNYSTGAYVYIDLFPTTKSSTTTPATNTTTDTSDTNISLSDSSDVNTTTSSNSTIIDLGNRITTKASEIYGTVKSGLKTAIPWVLWGLLVIVVLIVAFFGGRWIIKWDKKRYISGTKHYDDLVSKGDNERPVTKKQIAVKSNEKSGRGFEGDLERAEQKIKEAQEEIARIKSRKNRLSQAQAKYEEARRELEDAKDEEGASEL